MSANSNRQAYVPRPFRIGGLIIAVTALAVSFVALGPRAVSVGGLLVLLSQASALVIGVKRQVRSPGGAHVVAFARTFAAACAIGLVWLRIGDSRGSTMNEFQDVLFVVCLASSAMIALAMTLISLLFQLYFRWRRTRPSLGWPVVCMLAGFWGCLLLLLLAVMSINWLMGRPTSWKHVLSHVTALDWEFIKILLISIGTTTLFAVYWVSRQTACPGADGCFLSQSRGVA
jgi:hypothetical protein